MQRLNTVITHLDSRVMNMMREIQQETEDVVFLHLACHGVVQHWECIDPLQFHLRPLVYLGLLTQESAPMLLLGKVLVNSFLVQQTIHLLDHTVCQLALSKY